MLRRVIGVKAEYFAAWTKFPGKTPLGAAPPSASILKEAPAEIDSLPPIR
jgi:hypothetical protein